MNPEQPHSPREELELKITALLLGELDAAEADRVRQAIEQDPELAKLHDQLKQTLDLVKEASSDLNDEAEPLRLSDEKRKALLARFRTIKPSAFHRPKQAAPHFRVLELAAVLAIVALLAALLLPSLSRSKSKAATVAVRNNMRQIELAKQLWAADRGRSTREAPTQEDLEPYLDQWPTSVSGEDYVPGSLSEPVLAEGKSGLFKGLEATTAEEGRSLYRLADSSVRYAEMPLASAAPDSESLSVASSAVDPHGPLQTGEETRSDRVKIALPGESLTENAPSYVLIEANRAHDRGQTADWDTDGLYGQPAETLARFGRSDDKATDSDHDDIPAIAFSSGGTTLNWFEPQERDGATVSEQFGTEAATPPATEPRLGVAALGPPSYFKSRSLAAKPTPAGERSMRWGGADAIALPAEDESGFDTYDYADPESHRHRERIEDLSELALHGKMFKSEEKRLEEVAEAEVALGDQAMVGQTQTLYFRAPATDKSAASGAVRRSVSPVADLSASSHTPALEPGPETRSEPAERSTTAAGRGVAIELGAGYSMGERVPERVAGFQSSAQIELGRFERLGRKKSPAASPKDSAGIAGGSSTLDIQLDSLEARVTPLPGQAGSAIVEDREAALVDRPIAGKEIRSDLGLAREQTSGTTGERDKPDDMRALPKLMPTTRAQKLAKKLESESQVRAAAAPMPRKPDPKPAAKPAPKPLTPQPEVRTADNPFSTFSLNVSDVSFKLAAASLAQGQMPDVSTVRSEEFVNAFDYHDPAPAPGQPLAFAWERARYPFAHNRDLVRFSVQTAARGREAGRPLNLVLLLDNSGSMERSDRVEIIRECLNVLSGQLTPQDKVSVVTFARTARLWVDGVPGVQAAASLATAGQLTPEGGTNLEEAMRLAYATAVRHYIENGVNRVVLLTDGAANLGNADPETLKGHVEAQRRQGIALDCFGIGWEGYNDNLLEVLSRNGDGRYGFVNTPEDASGGFASQLAGALQVAASDVKVQVEFNPQRVTSYRQIGYAKHQLTKEQFRDNTVDAAEIGSAESGNALYVIETNPTGTGPVAIVRARFKIPATGQYREYEWTVPYTGEAVALENASATMRLAASASGFSEWLVSSPYAGEVSTDRLLQLLNSVPEVFGADSRPRKLEGMIRDAGRIAGN